MSRLLPCIWCGKIPESAGIPIIDGVDHGHTPHGATLFSTRGHYGSTFFDSVMGTEMVQLSICDDCLFAADPSCFKFYRLMKGDTWVEDVEHTYRRYPPAP